MRSRASTTTAWSSAPRRPTRPGQGAGAGRRGRPRRQGKTVNTASRNDSYGDALVSEFKEAYEALGGTVGKSSRTTRRPPALNSEAQQIVEGNPDGWVIIDYTGDVAKLGPALVRTGNWDPAKTFTGDGLRLATCRRMWAKRSTEGIRGTAPGSPERAGLDGFDSCSRPRSRRTPSGRPTTPRTSTP